MSYTRGINLQNEVSQNTRLDKALQATYNEHIQDMNREMSDWINMNNNQPISSPNDEDLDQLDLLLNALTETEDSDAANFNVNNKQGQSYNIAQSFIQKYKNYDQCCN